MARNGSGTYTAPANSVNPAVGDTTIDASDFNDLVSDLETALSESIARDGQTTTTASIPFASGIKADTIAENSANTGVTVDGLTLKDGGLADTNGNEALKIVTTASAVNELTITPSATGNAVQIGPSGDDTNISVDWTPKGTGDLQLNGMALSPVVQVVNTQTGAVSTGITAFPLDDTIPQNTEGDEYITLAITPKHTDNILIIEAVIYGSHSSANNGISAALFQDTTANALAAGNSTQLTATHIANVSIRYKMTAGTTSETTFKIRAGGTAGASFTFNGSAGGRIFGGVMSSSITITEYAA